MKKVCMLVLIVMFFSPISCTNVNQESSLNNPIAVVKTDSVDFEEIDSAQDSRYIPVKASTNTNQLVILGKFASTDDSTDTTEFSEIPFARTKYYQYEDASLCELDYPGKLGIKDPNISPIFINSNNDLYLSDGCNYLFLREDESTFTRINEVSSRVILFHEFLPWILIDNTHITPNEYVLCNLENNNWYTFSFDYEIRKFYKLDDLVIFTYTAIDDPDSFSYQTFVWKTTELTENTQSTGNIVLLRESKNEDNSKESIENNESVLSPLQNFVIPDEKLMIEHFDLSPSTEYSSVYKVSMVSSRDEKGNLEGMFSHTYNIVAYNKPSSELVHIPYEKNQINVIDINTGEIKKTFLSDTSISRISTFQTEDLQGFWVLTTATSVGEDNTVHLFTWNDNQIQLREYYINSCYFSKNAFTDKQGNLYLISINYSHNTPTYQMNVLDPTKTNSYQSYTIETSSPFLQKHVSPISFTKLFINQNQVLLQATNYDPDNPFDEHMYALYRIQFNK